MAILFRYPLFVCFQSFVVVKSRAVITFTDRVRRFAAFAFVFLAILIKLVFFSNHIFCSPRLRSDSRTTVFYSVRVMGYLLAVARVLTLLSVVFGRISGKYFDLY